MRLVTVEAAGVVRFVAVTDGAVASVLDLATALAWQEADQLRTSDPVAIAATFGEDLLGFIRHQARSIPAAGALLERYKKGSLPVSFAGKPLVHPIDAVTLLAPLPRP